MYDVYRTTFLAVKPRAIQIPGNDRLLLIHYYLVFRVPRPVVLTFTGACTINGPYILVSVSPRFQYLSQITIARSAGGQTASSNEPRDMGELSVPLIVLRRGIYLVLSDRNPQPA